MLLLMVHQLSVFQLTAARRRLGVDVQIVQQDPTVSTHSRPKAAGIVYSFAGCTTLFQLTAARRRLALLQSQITALQQVSTHSRPKAAGFLSDFKAT